MTRFYLPPKLRAITLNSPEFVVDYYVYQWRDGYQIFYIGTGIDRRAWSIHRPLPEKKRIESANFSVEIIRHALTKKQAHCIERLRMIQSLRRGCVLLNQKIPHYVNPIKKTQ